MTMLAPALGRAQGRPNGPMVVELPGAGRLVLGGEASAVAGPQDLLFAVDGGNVPAVESPMRTTSTTIKAALLAATAAAIAAACGGSNPVTPAGVTPGSIGATITLTANGATPLNVFIERTQRVRIINNDTRPHQLQTNPHNLHTDCPPNNVAIINPGQTVDTEKFEIAKACGYHDHLLPDQQSYWGVIRVAVTEDTRGPVYSRGW